MTHQESSFPVPALFAGCFLVRLGREIEAPPKPPGPSAADSKANTPVERIVEACVTSPIPPGRAFRLRRWRKAGLFRDL